MDDDKQKDILAAINARATELGVDQATMIKMICRKAKDQEEAQDHVTMVNTPRLANRKKVNDDEGC